MIDSTTRSTPTLLEQRRQAALAIAHQCEQILNWEHSSQFIWQHFSHKVYD